jgi:sulfonate transport system permease protein
MNSMYQYLLSALARHGSYCYGVLFWGALYAAIALFQTGDIVFISEVFHELAFSESYYWLHALVTLEKGIISFGIALASVVLLTILGIKSEIVRTVGNQLSFLFYSLPLIVVTPISSLIFGVSGGGIFLGTVGAFLPMYLAGVKEMNISRGTLNNVVKAFGGGQQELARTILLPSAARGWLLGSQASWVWALLGAMLGDFTGSRWGLGTLLVGTITKGNPASVTAIIVLCMALSGIGLIFLGIVSSRMDYSKNETIDDQESERPDTISSPTFSPLLSFLCGLAIIIILWELISRILGYDMNLFPGPVDLVRRIIAILNGNSSIGLPKLWSLVLETTKYSIIGIALSMILGLMVASSLLILRPLGIILTVPILAIQVTPILAFLPLLALTFGRGPVSIFVVVVTTTVYTVYTLCYKAMTQISDDSKDVVMGMGGGNFQLFWYLRIRRALFVVPVAVRLTAGRALFGAITAEYLITGTGLGGQLGYLRSVLDFGMVWILAGIVLIVTILLDRSSQLLLNLTAVRHMQ